MLRDRSGEFQMGIVDVPFGVVPRDDTTLDVLWKRKSPQYWCRRRGTQIEDHSTHSGLSSIAVTSKRRLLVHDLRYRCRAVT